MMTTITTSLNPQQIEEKSNSEITTGSSSSQLRPDLLTELSTEMSTGLSMATPSHSFEIELNMGSAGAHGPLDGPLSEFHFVEKSEGFDGPEAYGPSVNLQEASPSAMIEGLPILATDSMSLPAALCDDLLLEEINSIPDKMGFKIGDVADLLGIKQYVLRYWESEFDILRPKKASNNQRMYSRKDVENAFLIRKLLHRDRFSIEGARNALKELKAHVRKEKDYTQVFVRLEGFHERIEDLAREIRGLRRMFRT